MSDPGHLANGAFTLPQPLQVAITPNAWTGPVSNAPVAIRFTQAIGATDALRTGVYSRDADLHALDYESLNGIPT